MQSVLTVVTPADSQDLTILATVKAECGITSNTEDANIEIWIDQASAACAAYCNRVFGLETVSETFRNRTNYIYRDGSRSDIVVLKRLPVSTVTSVTEDGTVLVADVDYQLDAEKGFLYRLNPSSDTLVQWSFNKLVVVYAGGYALLGSLPGNVERACITQVKALRAASDSDPRVKQENVPGVLETTYIVGTNSDNASLGSESTALLDPFREVSV